MMQKQYPHHPFYLPAGIRKTLEFLQKKRNGFVLASALMLPLRLITGAAPRLKIADRIAGVVVAVLSIPRGRLTAQYGWRTKYSA
jgi:hypothetical protein